MNWDWEKLQEQHQRRSGGPGGGAGGGPVPPDFDELADRLRRFKDRIPGKKFLLAAVGLLWLLSGIYIVEPDEVGVVMRFGAFDRITEPGPHLRIPWPVEEVITPKVTRVNRLEFGFRSLGRANEFQQGKTRPEPQESLMLTGDENIVNVEFIVQFVIKDPKEFLFNVADPEKSIRSAAEAALREVIGKSRIDDALTTGKEAIQAQTRQLMQQILDIYRQGITVTAVQLQDVHPPAEVIDAFKDVASAREDKSRFINEAEAYRNDILPRARGQAAVVVNEAEAYRATVVNRAEGEAARFLSVLAEYNKAKDVTRQRLYLEAMERIFSNPEMEKVIMSSEALRQAVPYLPLDRAVGRGAAAKTEKP